jgi:hypothetical protein
MLANIEHLHMLPVVTPYKMQAATEHEFTKPPTRRVVPQNSTMWRRHLGSAPTSFSHRSISRLRSVDCPYLAKS